MNLLLGCEMGGALLKQCKGASTVKKCWSVAIARASHSEGPQLHHNVQCIDKGAFPAQLGRLRGQISLNASGDEPVAVVLDCESNVLVLLANDIDAVYGVWDVTEARFHALSAEDMYGTPLTTLIQRLCKGDVWVAYFLSATPSSVTVAPPASHEEEEPAPTPAPVTKKKTVARKRTAAAVVSTNEAAVTVESKKPLLVEEESGESILQIN